MAQIPLFDQELRFIEYLSNYLLLSSLFLLIGGVHFLFVTFPASQIAPNVPTHPHSYSDPGKWIRSIDLVISDFSQLHQRRQPSSILSQQPADQADLPCSQWSEKILPDPPCFPPVFRFHRISVSGIQGYFWGSRSSQVVEDVVQKFEYVGKVRLPLTNTENYF